MLVDIDTADPLFLALTDGYHESTEFWADLRAAARAAVRGAPVVAMGDGAAGMGRPTAGCAPVGFQKLGGLVHVEVQVA
jgi:hypothetical protein